MWECGSYIGITLLITPQLMLKTRNLQVKLEGKKAYPHRNKWTLALIHIREA